MKSKPKTVPDLRFPGFVGAWNRIKLAIAIDSIDSGWSPQCSDQPAKPDEWGILKTTSVVWSGYIEEANKRLLPGFEPREHIEVKARDILITRAGPSERVGVVAHVDRTRPMLMLSDKIIRLRCNDLTDSRFIARCISSRESQDHLLGRKSGLAKSQTNISQNDLKSVPLALPTLPEQRKIAEFLTAVDGRIGQLSQKKALLEDYKKGVMQQLFTQALRFKDDHGNDFPKWEEKTLGDAVIVNPKTSDLPDSFIYIDLESVNAGVLHSPRRISKVDAPSRAQRLLKRGDILYQTVRPYQMNNYLFDLEGVHVASTGYAQLRASKTDARFIYHSLHLPRFVGDVMDRCTGTSYPAINSKDLTQIAISIPSLPEQTKIANFLTALDRKIESVSQQITHTQAFKKGLLQQMFV